MHEIRERVAAATGGLTSSAGIGHSRMAAKVAADIHKPNGQHCAGFSHDEVLAFLGPLSVRKLPGVGRVLEKELSEVLGVSTIAELRAELPRVFVAFSEGCADFLLRASHGGGGGADDDDADGDGGHQKGISCERTFAATSDAAEHRAIIGALSATLASQLAERGLRGGGVTLKLKTAAFDLLTAKSSRGGAVATEAQVRERALALSSARTPHARAACARRRAAAAARGGAAADDGAARAALRLIGVRVGKLSSTAAPTRGRRPASGESRARCRARRGRPSVAADALGGKVRRRARARFDASEIDEPVLARAPARGAARREVRAEIAAAASSAAAAAAARGGRRRSGPRARAGAASGWAAGGEAPRRRRKQQPTLAAFVSGNGGANGGGASGWRARNPMAEAFRSRGRTGPLAPWRALGRRRRRSRRRRPGARESHATPSPGSSRWTGARRAMPRAQRSPRRVATRARRRRRCYSRYMRVDLGLPRRSSANAFPCAFSWSSNLRVGAVGEQVARRGWPWAGRGAERTLGPPPRGTPSCAPGGGRAAPSAPAPSPPKFSSTPASAARCLRSLAKTRRFCALAAQHREVRRLDVLDAVDERLLLLDSPLDEPIGRHARGRHRPATALGCSSRAWRKRTSLMSCSVRERKALPTRGQGVVLGFSGGAGAVSNRFC